MILDLVLVDSSIRVLSVKINVTVILAASPLAAPVSHSVGTLRISKTTSAEATSEEEWIVEANIQ